MSEQELLKRRIDAYSFAAWELHLFLDSHPTNCEAAKKLDEYHADIEKLTAEYESKYGAINLRSSETSRWQWVNGPWPWEGEGED